LAVTQFIPAYQLNQCRHHINNRHWNPKWKKFRAQKFVKMEIPDLGENFEELTPDEKTSRMKRRGILPARPYMERPFYISCTGAIFEPYVPPEGDGKVTSIKGVLKEKAEFVEMKGKSWNAIRKVRNYDEDFDTKEFSEHAQDIYIKAHEALANRDKHKLREFVTERVYPEMMHNTKDKTIRWKFIKSLEAPKIIHARCTEMISKENIFGQITVRFHTQQTLAVYDRFGRLMHGSEIIAKDVLEYVVFEKHLANLYGVWKMHDKIIPDWAPPREPRPLTYVMEKEIPKAATEEKKVEVATTQ
jgi:large subunit ribosomal protein L45